MKKNIFLRPLSPKTIRSVLSIVYAIMLVITWQHASIVMQFQTFTPAKLTSVFTGMVQASGPEITVHKGIVSTSSTSETLVFTPPEVGPTSFALPGEPGNPFSTPFTCEDLAAKNISSSVSGVQVGEKIKFALAFENKGNASAQKVTITDVFPDGFEKPQDIASLHLQAFSAAGEDLSSYAIGGFFGFPVEGGVSDGVDTSLHLDLPNGLPVDSKTGSNILVITYDLVLTSAQEVIATSPEPIFFEFTAPESAVEQVTEKNEVSESGESSVPKGEGILPGEGTEGEKVPPAEGAQDASVSAQGDETEGKNSLPGTEQKELLHPSLSLSFSSSAPSEPLSNGSEIKFSIEVQNTGTEQQTFFVKSSIGTPTNGGALDFANSLIKAHFIPDQFGTFAGNNPFEIIDLQPQAKSIIDYTAKVQSDGIPVNGISQILVTVSLDGTDISDSAEIIIAGQKEGEENLKSAPEEALSEGIGTAPESSKIPETVSNNFETLPKEEVKLPSEIGEGKIVAGLVEDSKGDNKKSEEIGIKIADVVLAGKTEGEDLSQEEAISALLAATVTKKELDQFVVDTVDTVVGKEFSEDPEKFNHTRPEGPDLAVQVQEILDTTTVKEQVLTEIAKQAVENDGFVGIATAQNIVESTLEKNGEVVGKTDIAEYFAPEEKTNAVVGPEQMKPILQVTATSKKNGRQISIPLDKIRFEAGSVVIYIQPIRTFTPGLYTLEVEVTNPITEQTETITQDFAWGVLAMNTDKDSYKSGETAKIDFGVLNDEGEMVCDADVSLSITKPSGEVKTLSTTDKTIQVSGTCTKKEIGFIEPDYFSTYTFSESGNYKFSLSATTESETRNTNANIDVNGNRPIFVSRTSATRLYPMGPAPMTIEVEFLKDYTGSLIEILPEGFEMTNITPEGTIAPSSEEGSQTITWEGSWTAGQTATFSYDYDAPNVSPEFYLIGPMQSPDQTLLEQRTWQIANDAAPGNVTTSLALWLKANAGTDTTTDGATVSTWTDQSSAGNNATVGAGTDPAYKNTGTGLVNGYPTIEFDGGNDYMQIPNLVLTQSASVFVVAREATQSDDASTSVRPFFLSDSDPYSNKTGYAMALKRLSTPGFRTDFTDSTGSTYIDSALSSYDGAYHIYGLINTANTSQQSYKDSKGLSSPALTTADRTASFNTGYYLARDPANTRIYLGNIAEVIAYQYGMTDAERNRVESYLALKYGLTLDQTTARSYLDSAGTTIWDSAANASYTYDITGIGQDDNSSLTQSSSQSVNSDAIVAINTPSDMTSGEFLVIGNDNGSLTPTLTGVPSGVRGMAIRIWKADKTGDLGTVTVTVNVSTFGLPGSMTAGDFSLILDSNTDFTTGATLETGDSYASSIVTFNSVNFSDNQIFTIGWDPPATPGGVYSTIHHWLKADAGVTQASGEVSAWADQVGNGVDFTYTAGASAGTTPDYETNVINGQAAINFNNEGTGDYLGYANFNFPETEMTNIFVMKRAATTRTEALVHYFRTTLNDSYYLFDMNGLKHYIKSAASAVTVGNVLDTGEPIILTLDRTSSSGVTNVFQNGLANAGNPYTNQAGIESGDGGTYLFAQEQDSLGGGFDSTQAYQGYIAEEFLYGDVLSASDRNKVESYLALKYGITLDQTSATNYTNSSGTTIWNATTNSGYKYDVAGIGQDDYSALTKTSSKSTNSDGMLTVSSPSDLANNEFLIWGNDNGALTETLSGVPDGIKSMLSRIWKVQETGSVGTVTMAFDLTGLTYSGNGANDFYLITDTDTTFTSGATTTVANSYASNIVTFNNVDLSDGTFFALGTFSDVGPGGVSANMKLWLKSDTNIYLDAGTTGATDGNPVQEWHDRSGNNSTLSSSGTARPTYRTNQLNGYPIVDFDGSNDYLSKDVADWTSGNSMFIVTKTTASEPVHQGLFANNDGTADVTGFEIDVDGSNNYRSDGAITSTIGSVLSGGTATYKIIGLTSTDVDNPSLTTYLDGLAGTPASTGSSRNGQTFANYVLGRDRAQTNYLDTNIAEVIIYNSPLSSGNLANVNSYLALKYGITLDQTSAQNYVNSAGTTIWNATTNALYKYDIAGIGKDDSSGLNQTSSTSVNSDATVTVSNPSSLGDLDYLIWGNDNGAMTETTTGIPTQYQNRLTRIWKVQETNEVGTVSMAFDLSGLTISGTAASDFALFVDADTDFSDATIYMADSYSDSIASFSGISLSNGNTFALATERYNPGGVATNLKLWLKGDAGVTQATNLVSAWTDQTGLGNSFSNTGGTARPTYQVTGINGNPSILFNSDSTNDYLSKSNFAFPTSASTHFIVMKRAPTTDQEALLSYETSGGGNDFILHNTNSLLVFVNSTSSSVGNVLDTGIPTIIAVDRTDASGATNVFENGKANSGNSYTLMAGTTPASGGTLMLGQEQDTPGVWTPADNQEFTGDIAEVLMYDAVLSSANRNKVESYLSLKYGITLDQTSATNYVNSTGTTIWDATANATYKYDIAGIGQDDESDLNQTSSKSQNSDGIVTVSSPSALADGDFLIWGNDNGATTETTSGVPSGVTGMLQRKWKVQEIGETGTTTLSFDLTGLTISGTQASDFNLITDTDADFTSGATVIPANSYASNIVTFTGISLSDGNFFALGTAIGTSISGTVYSDEGSTPIADGTTVRLLVNGVDSGRTGTTSGGNGAYSINGISALTGDVITLYLDDETENAVTVSRFSAGDITGMNLYQNYLITRTEDGTALTNTNLDTANNADPGSSTDDLTSLYNVSGGTLSTTSGTELMIWTGDSFTPGGAIDAAGNIDIDGTLTASTYAINLEGNWDKDPATGTVIHTGTITFDGTSGQSFTNTASMTSAITMNKSSGTLTLASAMNIGVHTLTLTSGTLSANGNNITTSGTFSVGASGILQLNGSETSSTPSLASGSTIVYSNTTGTHTMKSWTYKNLTVNGAGATFNAPATTMAVNSVFTMTAGTFSGGTTTITIGGNLVLNGGTFTSSSGTLNLAGNFDRSGGGTFTANSGTVTLNGNGQSILGSTTFATLTKTGAATDTAADRTLTFGTGTTQTIGTLTISGASSSQKLLLRSSVSGEGNEATINATTTNASSIDIQDIDHANGPVNPATSTNSGNATGWFENLTVTDTNISASITTDNGIADVAGIGDVIKITWNGVSGEGNTLSDIGSVTADLLSLGGNASQTLYDNATNGDITSGDGIFSYAYTITAGAVDATGRSLTVTATHAIGSSTTGPVSETNTFSVDNIAPTISNNGTLSISTDNGTALIAGLNNGTSNQDKVTLAGVTISEADLSSVTLNVSALTGQSALAMGSESTVVTAGALDSGSQTFTITVTDDAGNTATTSSDAISVDNIAPTVSSNGTLTISTDNGVTLVAGLNNGTSNQDKVTLSGVTISEADLSAVSINVSALTGQSALAMGSESTVVMAGALDSPTQTFIITITDDAGNTSTTSSDAISVDNIAPIVSAACISVTGATGIGEAFKNSNTPQLSWDNNNDGQGGCADNVTDLAGVTPVVFNAANFRAVDTNKTATGLVNIYYALLSGALDAQDDSNNNVSVTVTDDAGNQTTRVGTANYRIDTNVPVLAEITPVAQSSSDTTPSYTFSSNDAGTITWGGGCRSLSNIALAQEMIINLDSDGAGGELSSGTYDACTITVTDSVGNISTPLTISEFTIDLAPPVISEVTVTPAASGATMIWTTNEMASSFARYYFIEGRKWTTAEADVNPKKIDHSLIVENLLPCTVYQYKLWSRDAAGNLGSSIASTFTTRGCRGAATIVRAQTTEVVSRDTGGSANLNGDVVLQIPPAYDASVVCDVDNGAVFQLKELEKSSVTMDIGTPENADNAISTFDFSAYCNYNEKVTSFEEPIDVTVTYEEGDISGLDESLLRIYRYNEVTSRWDQLQNCGTPDTVNHTITCETTNLSTFGIFAPDAPVIAAPAPAPQVSSGGSGGGGVSKLLLQQIENELAKNRTSDNEKGGDELKAAAPEVKEEICTTKLKDIEKHWSKGYVETLECKGIVKGKKNGTFAPDTPITRSELTKIALLMGGYKANGDIFPPFDDIPSRHWAIPYISEAMRRKIVKGYEDGTFRPDANVTRAEAVKILLVAARIDVISISSNYFRDVGKNDWFRTFVNFAYFQGIIKGYRDGKFHPNQPITRAEAAKITMLVMKLAEEQKKQ